MKAEPDSRVVKGKDVKFSVDDFETVQTTAWEGVRNYEARNIMQGMKVGDKVLFYHSNTKNPGIAGFAKVSREAYPDHTAWDENHPYYDPKSDVSSPKWFMIDLRFVSRVSHFVSLALLRHLSSLSEAPGEMAYLSVEDLKAVKEMALLNKGRLSVQRVDRGAWDTINKISREGDGGIFIKKAGKKAATKMRKTQNSRENEENTGSEGDTMGDGDETMNRKRKSKTPATTGRKSKKSRE